MARVWVYHKQVWLKGTIVDGGGRMRVRIDGTAAPIHVGKRCIFPMKHGGRRLSKARGEVLPRKAHGARPARFRVPKLCVEAVSYTGPDKIGDYSWQLSDEQQQDPRFGRALHVYNENMWQQMDKTSHAPGGGNAVARPYRQLGRSIGMPTGEHGGFNSLHEMLCSVGCTAKEAIDLATEEIIARVSEQPGRYDKIYYCKNADDDEELIGMGIFTIEEGARRYITTKLRGLPATVAKRAVEARRAIRA